MRTCKIAFATLRAEMSRNNITIIDLASEIGCTRDTMSNWLCNKTRISLEAAFKIQQKFFPDISLWQLFEELYRPPGRIA